MVRSTRLVLGFWCVIRAVSAPAAEIEHGLNAEIFSDMALQRSVAKRIDPNVDWHWNGAHPHPDVPADFYSIRWTGWIKSPQAGRYKLTLMGDDGFRMSLDGKQVLDSWKGGFNHQSVSVELTGRPQAISIEYFEIDKGAWISFWWQPLGSRTPTIVPTEALFPDEESANAKPKKKKNPPHGLAAEYFDTAFKRSFGRSFVYRTEGIWGDWNAQPGAPVDGGLRCTGFLVPEKSGPYKLSAFADNSLRIWIDEKPVLQARLDQDGGHSSAIVELKADTAHAITLEFVDPGHWGSYYLHWIPPESTKELCIPCECLYPNKQAVPKGMEFVTK